MQKEQRISNYTRMQERILHTFDMLLHLLLALGPTFPPCPDRPSGHPQIGSAVPDLACGQLGVRGVWGLGFGVWGFLPHLEYSL